MIVFITGNQGTGKSEKAISILKDSKYLILNEEQLKSPYAYSQLTKETEWIVLDEASHLDLIKALITSKKLRVYKKGKSLEIIKTPNIIIVSQIISSKNFRLRSESFMQYYTS